MKKAKGTFEILNGKITVVKTVFVEYSGEENFVGSYQPLLWIEVAKEISTLILSLNCSQITLIRHEEITE